MPINLYRKNNSAKINKLPLINQMKPVTFIFLLTTVQFLIVWGALGTIQQSKNWYDWWWCRSLYWISTQTRNYDGRLFRVSLRGF